MRNLKKILAMVLALIMSLSLMATASATTFSDDDSINDTYRQAVEVLNGLDVLKGDDNGFRPEGNITRAEVAAIIYRITTGDVTDARVGNFTPYGQFSDVNDGSWYAGYVTYSANAGYIKGVGNGKFNPNNNVTGYEVLTMILRTVGYDKAPNEFTGPDWQLHVASTAQQLGILDNCQSVRLGDDAKRQEVAEMIFRAILLNKVDYSTATLSYTPNNEHVADVLKLERIEGVVVANQWADLAEDYITVDENQTVLATSKGNLTLDVLTGLEDMGESRWAYVQDGTHVLGALEDTGKNAKTYDNEGAAVTSITNKGLDVRNAEHFLNFGENTRKESDWQLRWTVTFDDATAAANFAEWYESVENAYQEEQASNMTAADKISRDPANGGADITSGDYPVTYNKVIRANTEIHDYDLAIMKGIFASGASTSDTDVDNGIEGFVYAGTTLASITSNNTATSAQIVSNDHTYKQFYDEYIISGGAIEVTGCGNGEWLKIVDNDGDGKAEYVFKTTYTLAEITGKNNRTGLFTFTSDLNIDTNTADGNEAIFLGDEGETYEPAAGDVVVYAVIDGQALIKLAETVQDSVKIYNYRAVTIDTAAGETYEQSAIDNQTLYGDLLSGMAYDTLYHMYFDEFGYLRAYKPVDGDKHYGLLTEMYLTNNQNGVVIRNQIATAELGIPEDSGKVTIDEYDVSNHSYTSPNAFVGVAQRMMSGVTPIYNYLQRAIAHLGLEQSSTGAWLDDRTEHEVGSYVGDTAGGKNTILGWEFDYDHDTDSIGANYASGSAATEIQWSATNIAKYTMRDDGTVELNTATEYAFNRNNEQLYYAHLNEDFCSGATHNPGRYTREEIKEAKNWNDTQFNAALARGYDSATQDDVSYVYAVDYVMLDNTKDIAAKQRTFSVDSSYDSVNTNTVNAVDDTQFFIVGINATTGRVTGASYFEGYQNLAAINHLTKSGSQNIQAIYAVAQNTERDNTGRDYWIADVIVIEVVEQARTYDRLVLAYNDIQRQTKAVQHQLQGIDGITGEEVTVVLSDNWGGYRAPGFYALYNTEVDGDVIVAEEAVLLGTDEAIAALGDYADNGIYAGTVHYINQTNTRSNFLSVDMHDGEDYKTVTVDKDVPWYSIHSRTGANQTLTCTELDVSEIANLKSLDHDLIWVVRNGSVVFVVDTSFVDPNYSTNWTPALFLNDGDRAYGTDTIFGQATTEQLADNQVTVSGLTLTSVKVNGVDAAKIDNEKREVTVNLTFSEADVPSGGTKNLAVVAATDATGGTAEVAIVGTATGLVSTNVITLTSDDKSLQDASGDGGTLTWTLVVNDDKDSDPVIYTVKVVIAAASKNAKLASYTIMGVEADLTADKDTTHTGETEDLAKVIPVTIPFEKNYNGSASAKQLAYTMEDENADVDSTSDPTSGGSAPTGCDKNYTTTADTSFTSDGKILVKTLAEDGSTEMYYLFDVTLEKGITILTDNGSYDATPTTGKIKPTATAGTASAALDVLDDTGLVFGKDKQVEFTVSFADGEAGLDGAVLIAIGDEEAKPAKKIGDNKFAITVEDLAEAFGDGEDPADITISVDSTAIVTAISVKAGSGAVIYYERETGETGLLDEADAITLIPGESLTLRSLDNLDTTDFTATTSGITLLPDFTATGQYNVFILSTTEDATADAAVVIAKNP